MISDLSEKAQARLENLGEVNEILAGLIERLADEECLNCRFFPKSCHIWNNEGENLKHTNPKLFCDSEGKCKVFQESD